MLLVKYHQDVVFPSVVKISDYRKAHNNIPASEPKDRKHHARADLREYVLEFLKVNVPSATSSRDNPVT